MSRAEIAEDILREMMGYHVSIVDGFAPCPGGQHHTLKTGRKDFRVCLDGVPTAFCLHRSCSAEIEEFNKRLRRAIWFSENGDRPPERGSWGEDVAPAPKAEMRARPPLDRRKVWDFVRGQTEVSQEWVSRRSPVNVEECDSAAFLNHLFSPGECVLIFTSQYSQGDFGHCVGKGSFRLASQRGVKGVPSQLPRGAKEGVWFLVQPVTGQWAIKPKKEYDPSARREVTVKAEWTRRSEVNVTAWKYFVLESDELPEDDWLKVVVNLQLPIAAIYTSGKRSIHALVKIPVESKQVWDEVKKQVVQLVCPLGADPAALTAVRLSRLPGCMRGDKLQRLIYLNPSPDYSPIRNRVEVRE